MTVLRTSPFAKHFLSILLLLVLTGCGKSTIVMPDIADVGSFSNVTSDGFPMGWYFEHEGTIPEVGVIHESNASVLRIAARGGDIYVYTPLLPGDACAEHVEISASANARGEAAARLFFLMPGAGSRIGDPTEGTGRSQLSLKSRLATGSCLPQDTLVGFMVSGIGEIEVDNFRINSAATHPYVTPTKRNRLTRRHVRQMNHALVSVDDLSRLSPTWNTAQVTGVGENSHGAAGLFSLKLELVRTLVDELGYTHFALEMPSDSAGVIADYISGGDVARRDLLIVLTYPAWQTKEMLTVIEWLRNFSLKSSRQVQFHGVDTPRDDGGTDDDRMARAVLEIIAANPSEKVVVWADNTHVTKAGNAMGAQLSSVLGDKYTAVGTTFHQGWYSAYGKAKRYPAQRGYPGTHEHVLSLADSSRYFLTVDTLPADHPLRSPLGFRFIGSRPQLLHQFLPHRLADHFDVLGFVNSTDATTFLIDHKFDAP